MDKVGKPVALSGSVVRNGFRSGGIFPAQSEHREEVGKLRRKAQKYAAPLLAGASSTLAKEHATWTACTRTRAKDFGVIAPRDVLLSSLRAQLLCSDCVKLHLHNLSFCRESIGGVLLRVCVTRSVV